MKIKISSEKLNLLSVNVKLANKISLIEIELDLANSTKFSFLNSYSDFTIIPFSFSPFLFEEIKVDSSKSRHNSDKYSLKKSFVLSSILSNLQIH